MHDTQKLIELIHKEECLWNIFSEAHSQKRLKTEAWERVAADLTNNWAELTQQEKDKIISVLKKRWNNIRVYYKKDVMQKNAKHLSKNRNEYVTAKKYVFYDLLGFLEPIYGKSRKQIEIENSELESPNGSTVSPKRVLRSSISNRSMCTIVKNERLETTELMQETPDDITTTSLQIEGDEISNNLSMDTSQLNQESTEADDSNIQSLHETMATNDYLANNPNVAFLLSCAADMEELTASQRMEFKCGVIDLIKLIKYPPYEESCEI